MGKHVFISYRREGGETMALLLILAEIVLFPAVNSLAVLEVILLIVIFGFLPAPELPEK